MFYVDFDRHGVIVTPIKGSHHHFRHPRKPGTVTVPHPKKDLKKGLIKGIRKQAGLN
nr:type II toxin-antitoxin system HicA family toxin [uncultured Halomonas sp.]